MAVYDDSDLRGIAFFTDAGMSSSRCPDAIRDQQAMHRRDKISDTFRASASKDCGVVE